MTSFGRCPSCGAGSPSGTTRDPDGFITCGGCRQVAQSGLWGVAPAPEPRKSKEEELEQQLIMVCQKLDAANATIKALVEQRFGYELRNRELIAERDTLKAMLQSEQTGR
jgi:hypothetical protein